MCKCHSGKVISCHLGKYPQMRILGHMIVLFITFWGTTLLFSSVLYYYSLHSHWQNMGVPFSPQPCQQLLFVFMILAILPGFDLNVPFIKRCWIIFHMLFNHLCVFLRELSVQINWPFFNWVVFIYLLFFMLVSCLSSLNNSG